MPQLGGIWYIMFSTFKFQTAFLDHPFEIPSVKMFGNSINIKPWRAIRWDDMVQGQTEQTDNRNFHRVGSAMLIFPLLGLKRVHDALF